ncbi:MAG: hypothetical protein H6765_00935 [Candidatus Peribacteria bacterium]|nr:MAG: hypothetical protein H6765_00935 [Candidatus Peribacteria bacterium]
MHEQQSLVLANQEETLEAKTLAEDRQIALTEYLKHLQNPKLARITNGTYQLGIASAQETFNALLDEARDLNQSDISELLTQLDALLKQQASLDADISREGDQSAQRQDLMTLASQWEHALLDSRELTYRSYNKRLITLKNSAKKLKENLEEHKRLLLLLLLLLIGISYGIRQHNQEIEKTAFPLTYEVTFEVVP